MSTKKCMIGHCKLRAPDDGLSSSSGAAIQKDRIMCYRHWLRVLPEDRVVMAQNYRPDRSNSQQNAQFKQALRRVNDRMRKLDGILEDQFT